MNPWPYILAGYLITAGSVLCYLLSLGWRRRALDAQGDIVKRQLEDTIP